MSKRNADGTVTRSPAGKVLKSATYSPANLRKVLYPNTPYPPTTREEEDACHVSPHHW